MSSSTGSAPTVAEAIRRELATQSRELAAQGVQITVLRGLLEQVVTRLIPRDELASVQPTPTSLLALMAELVGTLPFQSEEIFTDAFVKGDRLRAALLASGIHKPAQLGKFLGRHKGMVIQGLTLTQQPKRGGRGMWWCFSTGRHERAMK